MRIIIIGAGGHGQVVADILWCMREMNDNSGPIPIGYLDDDLALHGQRLLDVLVLGAIADLGAIDHDAVVVAIGDNATRQRLYERLRKQGVAFTVARHPSAVVAPDVALGPGTVVCAGVVVNTGSRVGANAILNTACTVDHHNRIGDHTHVAPGVHLGGDVSIGEGAFVGIGSTVIPGRSVGDWSKVGAGSVVTKDIAAGVTAVGVPARVTAKRNEQRENLS